MQRAKKAVSDAEACLATFKKNPTNLAERDAFVQAATAIPPAITGLALYSKAAVSAACASFSCFWISAFALSFLAFAFWSRNFCASTLS